MFRLMIKFYKIILFLFSFIFLTGFLPLASLLGPGVTMFSSGNLYKAGAQFIIDHQIKKKTGKNSLSLVKDEVVMQKEKNDLNDELKKMLKKRIEITHKKLIQQNNHKELSKDLRMLVQKRVSIFQKKAEYKKINQ